MSFLCSACSVHFDDNFQRREHMREQWHVYNVKRRVAALPPISNVTYLAVFAQPESSNTSSDSESPPIIHANKSKDEPEPTNIEDTLPAPQECIFCLTASDITAKNLDHMAASHGLVFPDLQRLQTDPETLISYLHLVVADYCECLFCGTTKRSAYAARAHMLAKGHCMLNLSQGSEYLEFWESADEVVEEPDYAHRNYQLLSKTEMRLASGAIATSREDVHFRIHKRPKRAPGDIDPPKEMPIMPERTNEPQDDLEGQVLNRHNRRQNQVSSRTLALRDQMGLVGVSDAQRQSLAVSQRKIDLSALRSRNKAQWTLEKMGNKVKQKHFVPDVPGRKNG